MSSKVVYISKSRQLQSKKNIFPPIFIKKNLSCLWRAQSMSIFWEFMWLRQRNARWRTSSISFVQIICYLTTILNVLMSTTSRIALCMKKDFVLFHFLRFVVCSTVDLQPSHIILKINKSSHQILLLFLHCTVRCTIMSILLPLLDQSTLLSGFQTYVTATSSSDDIYCGKNKIQFPEKKEMSWEGLFRLKRDAWDDFEWIVERLLRIWRTGIEVGSILQSDDIWLRE
jgi:hypothetical protein